MPSAYPYLDEAAQPLIDADELRSRRAFYQLEDDDLKRLAGLRSFAEKYNAEIIEAFYELLLGHPESRLVFPDQATIERAKRAQMRYFLELFDGRCDLDYARNRLQVGATHERMGVDPKWYLGAYAHYLRLIAARLARELPEPEAYRKAYKSIEKIVFFDMSLAVETYIAASMATLERHQSAIRELSTPVIQVHEGILLLPIVGTIDTQRAQQIMETVLQRVVDEQARVIILDIAGVPVVDTKVADHLLKTTAAVRLVGAETILTGISAQVARTVVQLGVDISMMSTRSKLSEGIELALATIGKSIDSRT
jgi:rsbT co-antagonist protein RsbR